MSRAHQYFLPNRVWHITHRCHSKDFLLKFAKDRKRWLYWLFEAKKRFGLCVLNYIRDKRRAVFAKSQRAVDYRAQQAYTRPRTSLTGYANGVY
jgi:putative transposase